MGFFLTICGKGEPPPRSRDRISIGLSACYGWRTGREMKAKRRRIEKERKRKRDRVGVRKKEDDLWTERREQ